MSFVRVLTSRLLRNKVRSLEENDIWQLYHLLHFHKIPTSEGGADGLGSKVKEMPVEHKASLDDQYQFIHSEVSCQLISKLTLLERLQEGERTSGLDGNGIESDDGGENMEYSLIPLRSTNFTKTIPGVLVGEGRVSAGSVVCFFPGQVYVPSQVHKIPGYPRISTGNPYLMARTDGSIINAKGYNYQTEGNPLAVGHLIRHPPKGEVPNVMPFSFDVKANFPNKLLHLVPNKYYRKPGFLFSDGDVVLRTLVFIATRQIECEKELFLNYRLHPDSSLPDWYSSVDSSEDRQRWS